jgi:hypothetical protein
LCVLLACEYSKQQSIIIFMDGGWMVMDRNIQSVTDGQLFAQLKKAQTVTDERIVLYLE